MYVLYRAECRESDRHAHRIHMHYDMATIYALYAHCNIDHLTIASNRIGGAWRRCVVGFCVYVWMMRWGCARRQPAQRRGMSEHILVMAERRQLILHTVVVDGAVWFNSLAMFACAVLTIGDTSYHPMHRYIPRLSIIWEEYSANIRFHCTRTLAICMWHLGAKFANLWIGVLRTHIHTHTHTTIPHEDIFKYMCVINGASQNFGAFICFWYFWLWF